MKKTYIIPEAISISLDPKMPLLLGYSDSMGDGEILTKENVDGLNDSSTGGGKSIWDDEW